MLRLDISELVERFPTFRVAVIAADGLSIPREPCAELSAWIDAVAAAGAAALRDAELAALPEIRCWREAYKAFGVKKTSYRSSVERLLKNLGRDGTLPRVNALVDLYNGISVRSRLPVGADDLDKVAPPLAFRFTRAGDSFVALGSTEPDPPKPGEVVYADAEKCLCRRWNWYQDARSAVTPATRRAVLTVQALDAASARAVEPTAAELAALIERYCGGRTARAIADRTRPTATLV